MSNLEREGYNMMMNGFHELAKDYIVKNYKEHITMDQLYEMNLKYLRNISKKLVEEDENFKRYYDLIFNIEFCKYKLNR